MVMAARVLPSLYRLAEVGFAFLGSSAPDMALGPSQKVFGLMKRSRRSVVRSSGTVIDDRTGGR